MDGKEHTYWSLVESVRTPDGPRQRTLCHLGELNGSDHARWLRTVEVLNEQGEAQQLKLFPSHMEPPAGDAQVARVLVSRVRLFVWRGRVSSVPAIWGWNCGGAWNWIVFSSRRWMTIRCALVACGGAAGNQPAVRARQRTGN